MTSLLLPPPGLWVLLCLGVKGMMLCPPGMAPAEFPLEAQGFTALPPPHSLLCLFPGKPMKQ